MVWAHLDNPAWCQNGQMGPNDDRDEDSDSAWTANAPLRSTAMDRSALVQVPEPDEPPSVVTLMPEYGVDVPLWPLEESTDRLVPQELLAKLMAWQAFFDNNFRWDTGWCSEDAKSRWADEAVGLEAELREALTGKAEVVVDLWPLRSHQADGDEPA